MNLIECPVCGVGVPPTMRAVQSHIDFHGTKIIYGILGDGTGPKGIIVAAKTYEEEDRERGRGQYPETD